VDNILSSQLIQTFHAKTLSYKTATAKLLMRENGGRHNRGNRWYTMLAARPGPLAGKSRGGAGCSCSMCSQARCEVNRRVREPTSETCKGYRHIRYRIQEYCKRYRGQGYRVHFFPY